MHHVHRRMVREAIRNAVPAQRKKIQLEPTRLVREVALFKVDDNACVRVKHNRYSTPLRPGTEAEVRVDASLVEVRWEGELVARHSSCYQVQQEILLLEHYLGVLERKPGALTHSKVLAQYRQAGLWPDSFDRFLAKLIERHGASRGTREMIALLQQVPVHGTQALRLAIESALAC